MSKVVHTALAAAMLTGMLLLPVCAPAAPGDIIGQVVYPPVPEDVDVNVSDAALMPDGGLVFTGSIAYENGDRDMLTVRYLPDGSTAWALTYDTSWFDVSTALAVDPSGNVTVAGAVQDTENPSDGFFQSFFTDYRVIRYTAAGELVFETGGSGYDRSNLPVDSAVSPDGGAFVTGSATNPQQTYDFIYTVRYGPDGSVGWETFEDFDGETHVAGLALGRDGTLWVACHVLEGQEENFDIYLVRYDPEDGKFSTQMKFDDIFFDRTAAAVTTDMRGNVILAGAAVVDRLGHAFTLKYAPDGRLLWEYRYSMDGITTHADVVLTDSDGRVYVAGSAERAIGVNDVLLYVLSPDGELLAERVYELERECDPVAVMLDGSNDLVMALAGVSPDMPGEAMFVTVEGWPLERVRLTRREAAGLGADIRLHGGMMPVYQVVHRLIGMFPTERADEYHYVIGPGASMSSWVNARPPIRLDSDTFMQGTGE